MREIIEKELKTFLNYYLDGKNIIVCKKKLVVIKKSQMILWFYIISAKIYIWKQSTEVNDGFLVLSPPFLLYATVTKHICTWIFCFLLIYFLSQFIHWLY